MQNVNPSLFLPKGSGWDSWVVGGGEWVGSITSRIKTIFIFLLPDPVGKYLTFRTMAYRESLLRDR